MLPLTSNLIGAVAPEPGLDKLGKLVEFGVGSLSHK